MIDEISAAVLFLTRLIGKNENLNPLQIEEFKTRLSSLLVQRFQNHWFPEKPFKGQGYRCIRVNEMDRRDPVLEKAALECGLKYEDLRLPVELTVWVDPTEVCCRFGEHKGSYCTVASFKEVDKENHVDHVNETEQNAHLRSKQDTRMPKKNSPSRNKNHFNLVTQGGPHNNIAPPKLPCYAHHVPLHQKNSYVHYGPPSPPNFFFFPVHASKGSTVPNTTLPSSTSSSVSTTSISPYTKTRGHPPLHHHQIPHFALSGTLSIIPISNATQHQIPVRSDRYRWVKKPMIKA